MASFIGTKRELRRYIGPRLRNLVQQFTRKHRVNVAACEHCCGSGEKLESAHVRGRDRNEIIDIIASKYTTNEIITIDLGEFEREFKAEHDPIEKSFLILCNPCHRKYDARKPSTTQTQTTVNGAILNSLDLSNNDDLLPITLEPSSLESFKNELLISKKAEMLIYYSNKPVEVKPWNALQFSASSSVMNNLRSRPEFRAKNWQRDGIVKVHVKVIKNA